MLNAGTQLGPYAIAGPLGAGGMGEVYRARDTRLRREVAIKVLRDELAADPERVRRFEKEARAAAALNHPNILVLHDIGRHAGQPYLVTELLEGETLAERIAAGELGVARSVEFAIQIARALAAAHEKGIVHRDIKPSNVFVTTEGVAKLLDFGLARLTHGHGEAWDPATASTESSQTDMGAVLGTVGYMAPEQVRSLPVDHRADIFAFGCVLYEMLSGTRAFTGNSPADTFSAILLKDPPPLSGSQRDIPVVLQSIVSQCLEKRPENRFSSAHDLALALGAVSGNGITGAVPARPTRRLARWLRGHKAAAVAAVTALAFAAVATVALWWRGRPAAGGAVAFEPKRVAVAIFENQTGDAALDPVGKMAADWISEGLSRIDGIEVVPSSLVFGLAHDRPDGVPVKDPVRAIAEATGAGLVVSGVYYAQGTGLQLQARITDAISDKLLFAGEPASGDRKDPMALVASARQQVVDAIAARYLDVFHRTWATQAKPPRYESYREYMAGERYWVTDPEKAIAHFSRALELDPDFVLPRFALVAVYANTGDYDNGGKQLDIIDKSWEKLTPIHRAKLNNLRAVLAGRYEEGLTTARALASLAPGDLLAAYTLGGAALLANRPREAVEALTRPLQWELMLRPTQARGYFYFFVLTTSLHVLGLHDQELVEARRGRAIYPDLPGIRLCEIQALAALGRLEEMEKVILETLTLPTKISSPGEVLLLTAAELRVHGHREESLRMADRATEWSRGHPVDEGQAERARSELAECLYQAERWEEARALYAELATAHPDNVDYQRWLGCLAARRGDHAEARRVAEELRRTKQPYLLGRPTAARACIAALLGEREEAVALLRESAAEGVSLPFQHRDMDLEPLIGYPPFEELVRPKG